MVVLPSSRAAATLSFALLEATDRDAVLLPRITTPGRLVEDLASRLPHIQNSLVPETTRELILSSALTSLPWLRERRESAPGTAAELLHLFDDLRLHGRDPDDPCPLPEAASDKLREDHGRVREAWRVYRGLAPYDDVDRVLNVVASVEEAATWPGTPMKRLILAGFVDLNPTWARLMAATAAAAGESLLLKGAAADEDLLSGLLLATWRQLGAPTSPLHPERRVAESLGAAVQTPDEDERPLPTRLASVHEARPEGATLVPPEVLHCADPEQESLTIASRVVSHLIRNPRARICVATNDRGLGRRVAMQLRDAGFSDLDESSGLPLSGEPEGLLAWTLLRCSATGLAHEPLMELLTHPLVDFGRPRGLHRKRSLRFERELLRGQLAGVGLDGYRTRAREKDSALGGDTREMEDLVDDLAGAFEALQPDRESVMAAEHVNRLRAAWAAVAPQAELSDAFEATDDRTAAARRTLHTLLDDLSASSKRLPPMTTAEFASALSRIIAAAQVMPRRSPFLPVRITGLLEARLEHFDLLVLGGMDEERMPGRLPRPPFLGGAGRESAGLPGWRETMGMQAELFLRLVHNGDERLITWSRERDGQPVLPSPFVTRLLTAVDVEAQPAPPPTLFRAANSDPVDIAANQIAFREESLPAPAHAAPRIPERLSHSALKTYRDCPYRWLLERGFGLREQDEVIDRLQKRDMGEIVHACLADFLDPESESRSRLLMGDREGSVALLGRIAEQQFAAKASGLPQRGLWLSSFLRLAPEIVDVEIKRAAAWEPVALEAEFELQLNMLRAYLGEPASALDPLLVGRIDRIDRAVNQSGDPLYAVLDYKTGAMPRKKDVVEGLDLQLSLYALAVELGSVDGLDVAGAVDEGVFYPLKRDKTGPQGAVLPLDGDLMRDARTILAVAEAIADPDRGYPRAPEAGEEREPDVCRYCAVAGLCRRDERVAADELEGVS